METEPELELSIRCCYTNRESYTHLLSKIVNIFNQSKHINVLLMSEKTLNYNINSIIFGDIEKFNPWKEICNTRQSLWCWFDSESDTASIGEKIIKNK